MAVLKWSGGFIDFRCSPLQKLIYQEAGFKTVADADTLTDDSAVIIQKYSPLYLSDAIVLCVCVIPSLWISGTGTALYPGTMIMSIKMADDKTAK